MRKLIESIEDSNYELLKQLLDESAEFATSAEYENNHDCIYEIPRVYSVTKHGYHTEWCILRIDKGMAYLGGMCDDFGEFRQRSVNDLTSEELLMIANEIY
jgi:predicted translin family RNA/ssDNA-binding protein